MEPLLGVLEQERQARRAGSGGGQGQEGGAAARVDRGMLASLICGALAFVCFFLYFFCTSSLDPNEFGILQNVFTGTIEDSPVYRGGLHFVGPLKGFISFPATIQSIEASSSPRAQMSPILARTGADPSDPDSGGQPVVLSCSFQYTLLDDKLADIYRDFGGVAQARKRYELLSYNMISNTAQSFLPEDFWSRRDVITRTMMEAVGSTLAKQGHARLHFFELLQVHFAPAYEGMLTAIQVAEQMKVVNEYEQKIKEVTQSIAVMQARTDAELVRINAVAVATSAKRIASARKQAFHLKQSKKAVSLQRLQAQLEFLPNHTIRFSKMRALQEPQHGSSVVVAMPSVEERFRMEDAESCETL